MRYLLVLLVWLFLLGAASGQFYGPDPNDPRERRAARERAVARLGGGAEVRRFVEEQGDNAVKALAACSTEVGWKLAKWHADPDGLNRLPRPGEFLLVVADRERGGDDVALFAIENGQALRDVDAFEGLLREPLELSLKLKSLSQAASENRARRLAANRGGTRWIDDPFNQKVVLVAAVAVLVAVVAGWFRKRNHLVGVADVSRPREAREGGPRHGPETV